MSTVYIFSQLLVRGQYVDDDVELDFPIEMPEPAQDSYTAPGPSQNKQDFFFEFFMLFLIGLFLLNMFLGNKKNEKIATGWLYLIKPLFSENFSHTGVAEKEGDGEML